MICPKHNEELSKCGYLPHKENMEANEFARIADRRGMSQLSSYVWLECCKSYGVGGTPKSNEAYAKIMAVILETL